MQSLQRSLKVSDLFQHSAHLCRSPTGRQTPRLLVHSQTASIIALRQPELIKIFRAATRLVQQLARYPPPATAGRPSKSEFCPTSCGQPNVQERDGFDLIAFLHSPENTQDVLESIYCTHQHSRVVLTAPALSQLWAGCEAKNGCLASKDVALKSPGHFLLCLFTETSSSSNLWAPQFGGQSSGHLSAAGSQNLHAAPVHAC